MKHTFGTDVIGGLNVALASHKLDPSELTVSENGWTDEEGVWRVMPGPESLYTNYTSIKAMAAGRMGGADHVVWIDGTAVYDNGANVGTLATDDDVVIRDFDDKFFIMGATDGKNYVWDGNHLRECGAWQPQIDTTPSVKSRVIVAAASTPDVINAITLGSTTTITTTAPHGISVGWRVYLSDIVGTTELNGMVGTAVTGTTGSTLVLDIDSANMTAYSSGGNAYAYGCGLDGTYKWYMTCIVKLADGSVLEGKPRGLREVGKENDSLEASAITVTPTQQVAIRATEYFDYASANEFEISGTAGTDYFPGFRIYRTKTDGVDFYLDHEVYHGDTGMTRNTSPGVWYSYFGTSDAYVHNKDGALGAVYTPGLTDRSSHPRSSVMASVGQRLFMNDEDNPTRLYWTHLDGTDYVPELNYLDFPDDITAVGSAGDVAVAFSSDRMWRVSLFGGVPDVDEIQTPVGTTYGNALALTDLGLLFLRDDGLWATDGASPPQLVSRRAFSSLSGPVNVSVYGDTLALTDGENMYVMRRRDGSSYWHGPSIAYSHIDATGGTFYACDANTVYKLFVGSRASGAIESPALTIRQELKAVRAVLDVDGDSTPSVWVNGNRYSDYDGHDDTGTGRRLVRLSIPRLLNHVFTVRVELSGDAGLYGYWLECEG